MNCAECTLPPGGSQGNTKAPILPCGASSLNLNTPDKCHQETAQAGEKKSASLSMLVLGRTLC